MLDYFQESVRDLFLRFDKEINQKFELYNKWHRYERTGGLVYGYCRNYRFGLFSVSISNDCFNVLGMSMKDEDYLLNAMEKVRIEGTKKQVSDLITLLAYGNNAL